MSGDFFKVLSPVTITPVPAVSHFRVGDHLKDGEKVSHWRICDVYNCLEHVANVVEENVPARDLPSWRINEYYRHHGQNDYTIIDALGGEERAIMHLAHLHHILKLGREGPCQFGDKGMVAYCKKPPNGHLQSPDVWPIVFYFEGDELHIGLYIGATPNRRNGMLTFGG